MQEERRDLDRRGRVREPGEEGGEGQDGDGPGQDSRPHALGSNQVLDEDRE